MKLKNFLCTGLLCVNFAAYSLEDREYNWWEPKEVTEEFDDFNEEFPSRSISFFSGYLESQYTNQQLANFGIELLNAGDYLVSKIDKDNVAAKSVSYGLFAYVYYMYALAMHEIGHGLACRAYSRDFRLRTNGEGGNFKKSENFWGYFGKCMLKTSFSGSCSYDGNIYKDSSDEKEKLRISAGGVNNEAYISEMISNAIYDGKLRNKAACLAYLYGKLSPLLYAMSNSNSEGHDINNAVNAYKDMKINVSKGNFQTAYMISLIGGTSITAIAAMSGAEVESIRWGNFRVPDLFTYVTSYGISYKLLSGYELDRFTKFNFAIERVMHGISKNEISIGISKTFSHFRDLEISGTIYFGCGGMNLEFSGAIPITQKMKLTCGVTSCFNDSLHGERHAKKFYDKRPGERKKRSSTAYVGISYLY